MNSARADLPVVAFLVYAAFAASTNAAVIGNPLRGQHIFQDCQGCHSLTPNHNMTGPSLAGIFGRKAGTLASFQRYSKAIKASGVIWNDKTLDKWLTSPAKFIPGAHMIFQGLPNRQSRSDLIAYLKQASAAPPRGKGPGVGAPGDHNLKKLSPQHRITSITYCPDTYTITTADGKKTQFWERNLRFQTDSSVIGPLKGAPAIYPAGMVGDRASVIFSMPEEISAFIKHKC